MARWKIRFYRHPKPNPAQVSNEQTMSFKMFDDWRSCIKASQLHSAVWVGMLKQVAERQADREEAAAQLASIKDYVLWVDSGPAGGLRRQHQFTRIATGWVETALNMLNGNELGDMDDLDGLSHDQIDAIKDTVGDDRAPADAQAEVNDLAVAWKKVWGHDLPDKSSPAWPTDLGEIPPMVLVEALLAAANTFPKDTGLGWDRLHPRALNRLSRGLLLWICAVLHQAEMTGRWPAAAELVLIALLPKTDGGYRAIGLLPFLPRLWMRTRKT